MTKKNNGGAKGSNKIRQSFQIEAADISMSERRRIVKFFNEEVRKRPVDCIEEKEAIKLKEMLNEKVNAK